MRYAIALMALLAVTGCGADGEPVQPAADVNVGLGTGGLTTKAAVGLRKGPLNIRWGL